MIVKSFYTIDVLVILRFSLLSLEYVFLREDENNCHYIYSDFASS